ncbi:MAG: hypothetical protein QNI90_15080 [Dinoroseobacter sp.]|nr:hypothetical protein [Dinoroseobacter sp.]
MYAVRSLLILLTLSACAERTLTPTERAFTDSVLGPALDTQNVRIVEGSVSGLMPVEIPVRPRTTCREMIQRPRTEAVPGSYAAMVLGERVFYTREVFHGDFLASYPESMDLRKAMLLAHEMTHVWQWQQRELTGYHPFRAGFEHLDEDDPYLVEFDPGRPFLSYAFEQQGVIVEEFVCCRALDPDGMRTAELHRLVTQVFPAAARWETTPPIDVRLPWTDAQTEGICN